MVNRTDLLKTRVKHKTFGEGTITEISDHYLIVKFAAKESKFAYPDAFEQFIVAEDVSVQAEILEEINAAKQTIDAQCQVVGAVHKADGHSIAQKRVVPSTKSEKSLEAGFGPDYNVGYLAKQPILTYHQVEEQFGIKISGFGRGINRTPSTVVLISSVDKKKSGFVYHDHWTSDGDYIYSGEGKTGNQQMTLGNKAIIDAARNGKKIHLFVKFSPQEYYYQGMFSLVDYTYEDDNDGSGNVRKEYKFRLRKQHIEE